METSCSVIITLIMTTLFHFPYPLTICNPAHVNNLISHNSIKSKGGVYSAFFGQDLPHVTAPNVQVFNVSITFHQICAFWFKKCQVLFSHTVYWSAGNTHTQKKPTALRAIGDSESFISVGESHGKICILYYLEWHKTDLHFKRPPVHVSWRQ